MEKIAKALDIPVEAITEMNDGASINIISSTLHDNSGSIFNQPSFNPMDKIVELYDKWLLAEKEKVTLLQEVLRDKK